MFLLFDFFETKLLLNTSEWQNEHMRQNEHEIRREKFSKFIKKVFWLKTTFLNKRMGQSKIPKFKIAFNFIFWVRIIFLTLTVSSNS